MSAVALFVSGPYAGEQREVELDQHGWPATEIRVPRMDRPLTWETLQVKYPCPIQIARYRRVREVKGGPAFWLYAWAGWA